MSIKTTVSKNPLALSSLRDNRLVTATLGSIAPDVARELELRHDPGSNHRSEDCQAEIKCLGIEASSSFVREPKGNGVAERFTRTLKENFLWVRTFSTIEELRTAFIEFPRHYNRTWLVARHATRRPIR